MARRPDADVSPLSAPMPSPPDPEPAPTPTPGERPGDVIDRYELVRELGAGGMGTVWLARQSEPVEREVALKIIKLGMDTREVVVRFEAERQALAVMDHPHIAKVLDGGATASGRPYFVMEFVAGQQITEHCDESKLGVRERLDLFTKACEGIQHAHQKGIIHRDIKPGNVLVALQDGEPTPKVIDFGIAKATGAALTEHTMTTEAGQILGTPEYMAPEQLGLNGADVDTRADVYSLGVLLYELLTGTKPFDLRTLIEMGYETFLRTIREVDPDKPSTRLTKIGESATTIAANRRADARALGRGLDGDLDWIVMKALEKDRERRYETARGFAADVTRFLNDEPVVAAPPSAAYRARKFVRRRKKTVAAVATIVLLFIGGSIGTGIGFWRTVQANRSLDIALGEKNEALVQEARQRELAQENERRAREAEDEARREAERAKRAEAESRERSAELEQVAQFQAAQLSEIDPEAMGVRLRRSVLEAAPEEGRDALSATLDGVNFTNLALDTLENNMFGRTLEAIDTRFEDQPLVRASLLLSLAGTLEALGLLESATAPQEMAVSLRRAELGNEHPETLSAINDLGYLLESQGKPTEAEPLYREALGGRRRVLGDDHIDTLVSVNNLGALFLAEWDLDAAEPLVQEALSGFRRSLGDDDPLTLMVIGNMGNLLQARDSLSAAEPFYREVLEGYRRVRGDGHPSTLTAASNLAALLLEQGKLTEAEPLLVEALEGSRRTFGDVHPDTLWAMIEMGFLLEEQGELDEAEALFREAVEGSRHSLGPDHPDTWSAIRALRLLFEDQGRLAEAEEIQRELVAGQRRALGEDDPDTLTGISTLAYLLSGQGRLAEAESAFREALAGFRRALGDDHPDTQTSRRNLIRLLEGRVESARASAHAPVRANGDGRALGRALASLGALHLEHEAYALAEQRLLEADEALVDALNDALDDETESDPLLWQMRSDLGMSIAAQGRLDEAQFLLVDSAEWMTTSSSRASSTGEANAATLGVASPTRVVQRAIDLYEELHEIAPDAGHDRIAEEWRSAQAAWLDESDPRPNE